MESLRVASCCSQKSNEAAVDSQKEFLEEKITALTNSMEFREFGIFDITEFGMKHTSVKK